MEEILNKFEWIDIKKFRPHDEMAILVCTKNGWTGITTTDDHGFFLDEKIKVYNEQGCSNKVDNSEIMFWIPFCNIPDLPHEHEYICAKCEENKKDKSTYFAVNNS